MDRIIFVEVMTHLLQRYTETGSQKYSNGINNNQSWGRYCTEYVPAWLATLCMYGSSLTNKINRIFQSCSSPITAITLSVVLSQVLGIFSKKKLSLFKVFAG